MAEFKSEWAFWNCVSIAMADSNVMREWHIHTINLYLVNILWYWILSAVQTFITTYIDMGKDTSNTL